MAIGLQRSKPQRRPGRPKRGPDAGDVRQRLLDAATSLFSSRGFGEVGLREVAREAGVTPAMISYYFGDKQGLYEAMLEGVLDRILSGIRELSASPPAGVHPIEGFVRLYVDVLGRDPWIPQLLVREVLSRDTPLRQRFIERLASGAAVALPALFAQLEEQGALRDDLDPMLAAISLVGMSAFPFIAYPVLGPALGYTLDAEFRERLAAHTARIFLDGTRAEAKP